MKKSALLSLILMVVVAAFTFSACGEKNPIQKKIKPILPPIKSKI